MNTHSIELDGYYARSRGNSTIYLGTAGSHGNEQLQVTLGKGWEGLTVQVVFHPSKVAVQLPANGVLDVPWEATARSLTAMQGRIVFQGFDQDRLVNSTDLAYSVASHSPALGRDEQPYTPGIVEGVLNQMAADKDAILQAAQQTGQAKEAAAASAAEAASSAANAQQSAGAANTSAGQAAASASQAAGSAAAANETLTQVQTAGQEAQQKVKDAETEALGNISAAAPALPAVSAAAAWQSVTAKPDGTGYNLAAMAPIEATIRPTANGNPAVCENSAAWGLQGLKIYGKSTQDGTPSPENPVPIVSAGDGGSVEVNITGSNFLPLPDESKNISYNGVNLSYDGETKIFSTSGTASQDAWFSLYQNINAPSKVTDGGPEVGLSGMYVVFDNAMPDGVVISAVNAETQVESGGKYFKLKAPTTRIYMRVISGNSVNFTFRVGIFATPDADWTPYSENSQSLTLSTPSGLPGIPVDSGGNYTDSAGQQWICNVVDLEAKTKTQICAKEIITGTPNFSERSNYPGQFMWNSATKTLFGSGADRALSNFAEWKSWGTETEGKSVFTIGYNAIFFNPSKTMTADEINALFLSMINSEHPPVVIGKLETPITTPLSDEEVAAYRALQTYAGTTVVSTAEPVAGIEARYIMDGNKYRESVDKRLAALEAAQTGI